MILKKIPFIILLLLLFSFELMAQNLNVKSFKSVPGDMTARVTAPEIDQNGDKCALVKVRTTQKGFVFEGDLLGIWKIRQEVGEIWVYVSPKAKKIIIKHPLLGICDYIYCEPIREASVYIMELICGKVTAVVEDVEIPTQWIVYTSSPEGADVYIDDKYIGQTPNRKKVEIGKHTYRIEKTLYHGTAGAFELGFNKKERIEVVLKPNYGWADIKTTPEEGAEVLIDGIHIGSTPLKTERLLSGEHTLTIRKELYKDITRKIIITDNQTKELDIQLDANFGKLELETIPIDGAEVILDGKPTGKKTPCTLEKLSSGQHSIKLRCQWYEPKLLKVALSDEEEKIVKVELQPTFGMLELKATEDVEFYIDDKYVGKKSFKTRLIAGIYTIEARKDKYHTHKQTIDLVVGDKKIIELSPRPKYGQLDVNSTPFDVDIFLDGKHVGTTPQTLRNMLIGNYKLELKKEGYGVVEKTITVNENKTTEVNEILPQGEIVRIYSKPEKANVFINSKFVGETPLEISLSYGTHSIKVEKDGEADYKNVKVVQNEKNNFSFNVQQYKNILINSFPNNGKIYLNGVFKGETNKTLRLKFGQYKLKVVNGEQHDRQKIDVGTNSTNNYNFDLSKRKRFFISTNSSLYAPYGIRMGLVVGTGFYVAANFSEKPGDWATMTTSKYDYEVELKDNNKAYEDGQDVTVIDYDKTEPYYLRSTESDATVFNYNITAGLTAAMGDNWFFYYGLGYGVHHRKYKFERYNFDNSFKEYVLAKDINKSAEGVVVECGFIIRIKHIALTTGVSTIKFATVEGKLGMGIYF